MASFFNLTLDTTAPSYPWTRINGDDLYTTSTSVTLTVTISDSDTTGYQMKVWGISGVATEEDAKWETFAASKRIVLPSGDGLKTVYVKVRDDVGNETVVGSDTITLDTAIPVVTISGGPDKTKISTVEGFDTAIFNFMCDVEFHLYEVRVVPATNSTHEAGKLLTLGSAGTSGSQMTPNTYPANTNMSITITGEQLTNNAFDDGVHIIKVFVQTAAGIWSVT